MRRDFADRIAAGRGAQGMGRDRDSYARYARIPGYRPGKAPKPVIEKEVSQGNSGRADEEAGLEKLSRSDRAKAVARRFA